MKEKSGSSCGSFKFRSLRGLALLCGAGQGIMGQLVMVAVKKQAQEPLEQALNLARRNGVHMTRQRRAVLAAIVASCDHPTAAQLFERLKASNPPSLSLATVYNSLEVLSAAKVINHLNFNNGPARYCPNIVPHAHLLDDASGRVVDVHLKAGLHTEDVFELPAGCTVAHLDACLHGTLPAEKE